MTAKLIIALVIAFAIQAIAFVHLKWDVFGYAGLTSKVWRSGWIWQLVTFQFLHAGILHIFFNGLSIWWFGRFVEMSFGGVRMLRLWVAGGLAGALVQLIVGAIAPNLYPDGTVGASAGAATLFAIFCRMQPDGFINWNFILQIRARYLFYVSLAISAFFTVVPMGSCVAHAAHLGGLLLGWAYIHFGYHREFSSFDFPSVLADRVKSLFRRKPRVQPRVIPARFRAEPAAPRQVSETSDADFIAREVDPILEKIAQHGIQSLTPAEKRTLEAARQKVAKR